MTKKKGDTSKSEAGVKSTAASAPPLLTDPRGMGGVNAQDGFDYQNSEGIQRVPAWLARQSFEGIMFEGLEDFEARFFAASAPKTHFLDRFQAKLSELSKSELAAVFDSFKTFEEHHPQVARIQTLVTPSLPAKLRWLERDLNRVRDARPFYNPFPDILANSDNAMKNGLGAEFGVPLGDYVADCVEISTRAHAPDRMTAESWFGSAIASAFPDLDISTKKLRDVYAAMLDLVNATRGEMIPRARLLSTIERALGTSLGLPSHLHLHIRSDRTSPATSAVEIDASPFSGGGREVPAPDVWQTGLVEPLAKTAHWAYKTGYRRVQLSGQYRLSPAFVVGWAFRSSTGFELDIPTKDGIWSTDSHPSSGTISNPWQISQPTSQPGERLAVAVGVIRDAAPAAQAFLNLPDVKSILVLQAAEGIPNATEAQRLVQSAKSNVLDVATRLGVKSIDLFFVGPAAFAVALGHRWNAMPVTHLHEYDPATHEYHLSATLKM